jgi:CRP-like cAMP-binding protein
MTSHESKVAESVNKDIKKFKNDRLDIPSIKYFWQASPLATNKHKSIPKFLRSIKVFEHFSDYEMKLFSDFLHERIFGTEEVIIREGETGYGFYLVFSGKVEVYTKRERTVDGVQETYQQSIAKLSKYETFGELALIESQSKRNATVVSKGNSKLLAIYKPDIEELIDRHPVIGAKFLQAMSLIVAKRFNQVAEELRTIKEKCADLEKEVGKSNV